jgi:hypothetical protein
MQGPPLSPREVAAALEAQVTRFRRLGMSDTAAVAAVSAENGLAPTRVTAFIKAHRGESLTGSRVSQGPARVENGEG